mgnify:CR=1 FL=1
MATTKKTAAKKSANPIKKAEKVLDVKIERESPEDRIALGNEVLAAVNASLGAMANRGVPPEKIENAFYLAFQFAFVDFLRVTGFPFDDAVSDLRDMYNREVEESSKTQPQA